MIDISSVCDRIQRIEAATQTIIKIKELFGAGNRELSTTEKNLFKKWTEQFGYDIDVIVNEDRTFTIREHITAYFDPTASKHGIIRKIPLSGTLKRNNGTTDDYRARVTEENVSGAPYTTSRSGGYFIIKIGSASHTVSGQQEYVITYTYNMGKDPLKNVDELYLDLIGTD